MLVRVHCFQFVYHILIVLDSKDYGNRGDEVILQTKPTFKSIDLNEAIRKAKETAERFVNQTKNPLATNRVSPPPVVNAAPVVPMARPPRPGKAQTKPKLSNLEQFKEELKAWVLLGCFTFFNLN